MIYEDVIINLFFNLVCWVKIPQQGEEIKIENPKSGVSILGVLGSEAVGCLPFEQKLAH